MVTGHCRLLQQKDPRKVRLDYGKKLWSEVFDHNPRIAHSTDRDVQIYFPRPFGLRPYCSAKTSTKWTWQEYVPPVGELYFQPDELAMAARHSPEIVIEPNIKGGASPNKQWGEQNWQRLVMMLLRSNMRPVQLGPSGTRVLPGARLIETNKFRRAAAVLARAKAAVLSEGGMAHAAAVVGLRSVVIMGGYISPKVIGYPQNVNLFTGDDLGCGMRIPCRHCSECMGKISPEQVFEELKRLL